MKKTHKFCFRLPKSVDKAYKIDVDNGNFLWTDAIVKDMTDSKVTFKSLEEGWDVPIGYAYVYCCMTFDVKMDDFPRKARLVSGGHMTDTPATMTYAIIVYHDTVCLALFITALDYLEVKCGYVVSCSSPRWDNLPSHSHTQ